MMHAMNNLATVIGWIVIVFWTLLVFGLFVRYINIKRRLHRKYVELSAQLQAEIDRMRAEQAAQPRFRSLDQIAVERFFDDLREEEHDDRR